MNLYLVARFGNSAEGPNGKDSICLVRATDHIQAIELAQAAFRENEDDPAVVVEASACTDIGISHATASDEKAAVMLGPCLKHFQTYGYSNSWVRHPFDESRWIHYSEWGADEGS